MGITNRISKTFIILVFIAAVFWMFLDTEIELKKYYNKSVSGTVERKSFDFWGKHTKKYELSDGNFIVAENDGDIQVGDSIFKFEESNFFYIYRKDSTDSFILHKMKKRNTKYGN